LLIRKLFIKSYSQNSSGTHCGAKGTFVRWII
jgi:hypothetical protein